MSRRDALLFRIDHAAPVGVVPILLAAVVATLVAALALMIGPLAGPFGTPLVFVGIAAVGLGAFLALHNERLWVFGIIASFTLVVGAAKQAGIGVGEIVQGGAFLGGIFAWFVRETIVLRRTVLRTGFDVLLLSFVLLATIVAALAGAVHGADPAAWFKEWGTMATLLIYFPARSVIRTRRDILIVAALLLLVIGANGAVSILTYRERLAAAVFQWQLKARSNINEPLSILLVIGASTVLALANRTWLKLVSFGGVAVGLGLLAITYSRSPILSAFIGTTIALAFLPMRRAARVVVALLLSGVVLVGVMTLAYPRYASIIVSMIEARLSSVTSTTTDLSLRERISEATSVATEYIPASPVIGYGYGVNFRFHSIMAGATAEVSFIHNGYLWAAYKYGIPVALLAFGVIFYPLIRLTGGMPPKEAVFERGVVATVTGFTLCLLVMNITSTIFTYAAAMLVFGLLWAMLDAVGRQYGIAVSRPPILPERGGPGGSVPAQGRGR